MDFSITAQEEAYLNRRELDKFWLSRLKKKDPIARIGYALWCKSADDLKRETILGDKKYWGNKGFSYWEFMARTTVVNLATGLQKGGFQGDFKAMRNKIKEVGAEVARQHAVFVKMDIKANRGVPGLLSTDQIAKYHHIAFKKFSIPASYYGGTWLGVMPDKWEYKLYGDLYCHDCDAN